MATITKALLEAEDEVRVYIERYANLFDLDPNLVRGLITQESRFVAEAVSATGAYGYGQFTGIGGRQVQNISRMTEKAADLADFTKADADEPDAGVKAICATLWWLMYRKYKNVSDRKVRLEAVLTFYNSGGKAAALVVKHGGHKEAIPYIKQLPRRYQSQAVDYAAHVSVWFVTWHEHEKKKAPTISREKVTIPNPFDESSDHLSKKYQAFIQYLTLLADDDSMLDVLVNSRDGLTEVTLIFPGELG